MATQGISRIKQLNLQENVGEHWPSQLMAGIVFVIGLIVFIGFCVVYEAGGAGGRMTIAINVLVFFTGAVLGLVIGTLFSPFDRDDALKFESVGKAATAFLSGFVIAKADSVLLAFTSAAASDLTSPLMVRTLLFFASAIWGGYAVFLSRAYPRKKALMASPAQAASEAASRAKQAAVLAKAAVAYVKSLPSATLNQKTRAELALSASNDAEAAATTAEAAAQAVMAQATDPDKIDAADNAADMASHAAEAALKTAHEALTAL